MATVEDIFSQINELKPMEISDLIKKMRTSGVSPRRRPRSQWPVRPRAAPSPTSRPSST